MEIITKPFAIAQLTRRIGAILGPQAQAASFSHERPLAGRPWDSIWLSDNEPPTATLSPRNYRTLARLAS